MTISNLTNTIQRIEIGSGKRPKAGYLHIDIEPSSHADIIADFRTLSFSDLEEIRTYHLLEHFSRKEAVSVLKLWHFWLKTGGLLELETPDFEGVCSAFFSAAKDYRYWLCRHLYGSQEADWAYHRDGWWQDKYQSIMPEIGFEVISIEKNHSRIVRKDANGKHVYKMPNIKIIVKKI